MAWRSIEHQREYLRARERRLIAAGGCRGCLTTPADPGYASCAPCREKERAKYARQRDAGLHDLAERRSKTLQRRYGITLVAYQELADKQGGVCALCGGPPVGRGELAVDHDHATGRIRGLLCFRCNTALGAAEKIGIAPMVAYLKEEKR